MRVRTEDRRRAIVAAARDVFQTLGFDRASMATISTTIGGSKATLYGYFASKEELYAAVMVDMVDSYFDRFATILDRGSEDLRCVLHEFGQAYLDLILSPDVAAMVRNGIAGRDRGGIGEMLFDRGPRRCEQLVADFLLAEMDAARLRRGDPVVAAAHLVALLQAGLFHPYLFGAAAQIPHAVALPRAVDAFLRAYGPDAATGGGRHAGPKAPRSSASGGRPSGRKSRA